MAQRKPYNANSAYGRRKMREEHLRYRESLPADERAKLENDSNAAGCIIVIIVVVIALVIGALTGNMNGVMKWLSH